MNNQNRIHEVQMGKKEVLENELRKAMRENNPETKKVIRLALSSIKLAEVDLHRVLSEQEINNILQKEIANREETITEARKINRTDLIQENETDIRILREYLPVQATREEILKIIDEIIVSKQDVTMKDMGSIIKETISKLEGRAANNVVSAIVKQVLSDK